MKESYAIELIIKELKEGKHFKTLDIYILKPIDIDKRLE